MTEREVVELAERPRFDALKVRLRQQFGEVLGADPVCNGRVTTATIDWLADEAVRACEATYRHALRANKDTQA